MLNTSTTRLHPSLSPGLSCLTLVAPPFPSSCSNATRAIEDLDKQSSRAFDATDIDRISNTLQLEIKKASALAASGKKMLDAMKKMAEDLTRTNPKSERLQPIKAQHMRLCKSYVEAMKEHQRAKEAMRASQTDNLVRRGMILYDGNKSESEIRERVERDPGSFLREAIMEEASEEAQQAYVDAQSRARDVEILVRSLNEVAQMFQDLAALVQHQSDMLDSIESNVELAGDYMRKGNENIRSAIEHQKKARKCMCCILCVVIVVVLLLIAGLGSFFGGAFNKL